MKPKNRTEEQQLEIDMDKLKHLTMLSDEEEDYDKVEVLDVVRDSNPFEINSSDMQSNSHRGSLQLYRPTNN